MSKSLQVQLRLNNVRLSFPSLFKATAVKDGDKPAFSAQFIFPPEHPDFPALKKALVDVATGKWGAEGPAMVGQLMAADRCCVKRGDAKTAEDGKPLDGYAGQWFVSARSQTRPTLIDANKKPLAESDGRLYSGCYVNVVVAIWAQTGQYGKRLNAQLQGVQFAKDGDSFGGGRAASPDAFENIANEFGGAQDAPAIGADPFGSPADTSFL